MSETPNATPSGFHSDKQAAVDEFGRRPFAYRVAEVLTHQPLGDCLVVSVSGEWGSGKSTTLSYVQERLAELPCKVLEFNPWRFPGEERLLFELFDKLVKAIDVNGNVLTAWQRVAAVAERAIDPIASAGAFASDFNVPGTGGVLKSASTFLRTQLSTSIEKVKEQAIAYLEKEKMRVVVLMDDLDRLETDDLMSLLRIIKLVANLPNTSFVIAMDEDHVARTIGKRIGGGPGNGKLYLEKIIQVRLTLPSIPWSQMRTYALSLVQEVLSEAKQSLSIQENSRFHEIFDEIFAGQIRTPRAAKAWANALRFSIGILPDEVNTADLALLECARLNMLKLYSGIREYMPVAMSDNTAITRQVFGEASSTEPVILRLVECLGKLPAEEINIKRRALFRWFPNLQSEHWFSGPDDWERDRRICSKEYFWRFFTSTIPSDDMKDSEVILLLEQAARVESNSDEIIASLSAHLAKVYRATFLRKLAIFAQNYPAAAKPLALALAQIPNSKDEPVSALEEELETDTARACASLIEVVPQADRNTTEADCISISKNVIWSWEVRRLLYSKEENDLARKRGDTHHPSRILADRMLQELEDKHPFDHTAFNRHVWTVWHEGDRDRLKVTLQNRLETTPYIALHLLVAVCNTRTSPTPRPPERCFIWSEESLSRLEKLVEIHSITKALRSLPDLTAVQRMKTVDSVADRELSTPEELVEHYFHSLEAREEPTSQQKENIY